METADGPEDPRAGGLGELLRAYGATIYLPSFLVSVGLGSVIPATPLLARELGGDLGMAGLAVALRSVGHMALDVPAGLLVARLGDRTLLVLGAGATAAAAFATASVASLPGLLLLLLVGGGALSVFSMARLHYMAEQVPVAVRGRAMALLGGTARLGVMVGPIVGGFVAQEAGLAMAFAVQGGATALAALLFARAAHRSRGQAARAASRALPPAAASLASLIREHRLEMLSTGLVVVGLQVVRNARHLLLPLWGDAIGLGVAEIGLVVGLSSGLDMLLFQPAGWLMDRRGRRASGVPSLLLFALALALLPLVDGFGGLLAAGLLLGLGNGLSAGFVMTLGADLAPSHARGPFLGVWRLIGDTGSAAGPLVVGAMAQATSLGVAALGAAGLGLAAALLMLLLVGETRREP